MDITQSHPWGDNALRRLEASLENTDYDTLFLPADDGFPFNRLEISEPDSPFPPAIFFFLDEPSAVSFDAETRLLRLTISCDLSCQDAAAAAQLRDYLAWINTLLPGGRWSYQAEEGLLIIADTLYFAPAHFNPRVVADVLDMHRFYWEQFIDPAKHIASGGLPPDRLPPPALS